MLTIKRKAVSVRLLPFSDQDLTQNVGSLVARNRMIHFYIAFRLIRRCRRQLRVGVSPFHATNYAHNQATTSAQLPVMFHFITGVRETSQRRYSLLGRSSFTCGGPEPRWTFPGATKLRVPPPPEPVAPPRPRSMTVRCLFRTFRAFLRLHRERRANKKNTLAFLYLVSLCFPGSSNKLSLFVNAVAINAGTYLFSFVCR